MSRQFAMWIAAILMILASIRYAAATVNASFPGGGGTASVGNPSAGHYTVTLTRTDSGSGTIDALVTGANTDIIDSITVVTNNYTGITRVTVRGTSTGNPTGSLVSMTKTGTGPVTLHELRLASDLGTASATAIAIDTIGLLDVAGNVLGSISVVNDSFDINSTVSGNFHGNLTISSGSLLNLPVTGDFGNPSGSPVTVTVGTNVVFLTAKSFNVNMTVGNVIDTMTATHATAGDFRGSLTASGLAAIMDAENDGLDIADEIIGDIEFTSGMFLPLTAAAIASTGSIYIDGNVEVPGEGPGAITVARRSEGDLHITGELRSPISFTQNSGSITIDQGIDLPGGIFIEDTATYSDSQDIYIGSNCNGPISIGTAFTTNSKLYGSIEIAGDLTSSLLVISSMEALASIDIGGKLTLTGTVRIGSGLKETSKIQIGDPEDDNDSLVGQVIINSRNVGGDWDGTIQVDDVVLDGPDYELAAVDLGGGSVGLVPFLVNPKDANIDDGGYYFRPGVGGAYALPNPILIGHFGPIQMLNAPKVEVRDPYSSAWGPM